MSEFGTECVPIFPVGITTAIMLRYNQGSFHRCLQSSVLTIFFKIPISWVGNRVIPQCSALSRGIDRDSRGVMLVLVVVVLARGKLYLRSR